jgi:hypothetical protein
MTAGRAITTQLAALALDGRPYCDEGSRAFFAELRAAGFVAVYGASDDIMMMNGAIYDEFYGKTYLTPGGVTGEVSTFFIEPLWCAEPGISWTYKTNIPHETFQIFDGRDVYCRGIVFALADLAARQVTP